MIRKVEVLQISARLELEVDAATEEEALKEAMRIAERRLEEGREFLPPEEALIAVLPEKKVTIS